MKNFSKKKSKSNLSQEEINFEVKNFFYPIVLGLVFLGAFYLYQVNDLTNKGYEMKEVENRILQLKEENEKNKIQEGELRSMYNLEKNTKDFDLVNPEKISYLDIDGPVAMK